MKKFIAFLSILITLCLVITNVFAASGFLPVYQFKGAEGECWAVSASMVSAYYHGDTKDRTDSIETLVPQKEWSLISGIIDGIKWGTTDVYHSPAINPKEYFNPSTGLSTMTPSIICDYLNDDSPIVVRTTIGGPGYHAVVLKSYTDYDNNVKYNDPVNGSITRNYSEFYDIWEDCIVCY